MIRTLTTKTFLLHPYSSDTVVVCIYDCIYVYMVQVHCIIHVHCVFWFVLLLWVVSFLHDFYMCNVLPSVDKIPQAAQMTKLNPTDPVPSRTPFGEINTPEPEIK